MGYADSVSGSETAQHWDDVYRTKSVTEVSWFQTEPVMSLRLIDDLRPVPRTLIDVGAGASVLADRLVERGGVEVTVLDVSEEALGVVRDRLGARAADVRFLCADIRTWSPDRQCDAWHDRAVFHFLTDPADRDAYVSVVERAVAPHGVVVIGSFALDGPERCSGLPTARYDAAGLAEAFAGSFVLERSEREVHHTPGGADQAFTWAVLRRR